MAKVGVINGTWGLEGEVSEVKKILTSAGGHEVEDLKWKDSFYANPLQYSGFDLYVLVRSGGLSVFDRKDLRKVLESGRRVLLLYTRQEPAFKAKGFARRSLFSTRQSFLKAVKRLTSQA